MVSHSKKFQSTHDLTTIALPSYLASFVLFSFSFFYLRPAFTIHCCSHILPCDATASTSKVSLCHMRNLDSDLALSPLTFSESSSFGSLALRCRVGFGGASPSASSVFASWRGNMAGATTSHFSQPLNTSMLVTAKLKP